MDHLLLLYKSLLLILKQDICHTEVFGYFRDCQRVIVSGFMVICGGEERSSNFCDPPQRRGILLSTTCLGETWELKSQGEVLASNSLSLRTQLIKALVYRVSFSEPWWNKVSKTLGIKNYPWNWG